MSVLSAHFSQEQAVPRTKEWLGNLLSVTQHNNSLLVKTLFGKVFAVSKLALLPVRDAFIMGDIHPRFHSIHYNTLGDSSPCCRSDRKSPN